MEKLDLGKEKISKLLRAFSVPCIISLVVNALYNIIDQIFIGWGVGYLGNGATNVVFPITVICLAFSLMFGDGASSYLSLKLGEKKKKEAEIGVSNGIISIVVIAIALCALVLIFLPQLLNVFGCTDSLKEYALSYGYVIAIGLPFSMIGTTLNSIIRADGSPKYAMISMITGAVLNTILDPIAIFVLGWGVKGAAIATIISQIVTFIINIAYIKRFKSINITKESFKFSFKTAKSVAMLGISSFITQLSIVVVLTVLNKLFNTYGPQSEFGADIPITVHGIVMKISQILSSIIIGIAAGSQPIVGYNYGAKKYDRVKQTLKIVLMISTGVSIVAFILFQAIPEQLIGIFGSGDEMYNKYACYSFRIYLMLTIVNGIQIASGIFFQAIGKPTKSAILTLSRQILFLIPAATILSKMFGIMGILCAGPVADGLAFILAAALLLGERKNLNASTEDEKQEITTAEMQEKSDRHIIIAIGREYGSGGRYVGELLAKKLGIKLYDKELVNVVSSKNGMATSYIEENEQNLSEKIFANFNSQYYDNMTNEDKLFIDESNAIREIAEKESCVIVGRCADYVLRDNKDLVTVFLYSDDDDKVKRAVKYYGIKEKNALKEINKINKRREKHYNYYTGREWRNTNNYDIALNVDKFGVEKTAEILAEIATKTIDKEAELC